MPSHHNPHKPNLNQLKRSQDNLVRCFMAVDLDDDIKAFLRQIQKNLIPFFQNARVQWVRPEQMHLTLRFLGEITESTVQAMIRECAFLQQERPTTMTIQGMGCFPSLKNPRVIWVGCKCPETIFRMQEKIEKAAQSVGLEPEKKLFTPHLTLGRIKETRTVFNPSLWPSLNEWMPDMTIPKQSIRSVRLYRSRLTPAGPVYNVLHEFIFSAAE